ncbi:MAG: chitosanase [Cryptosporangiaceae bacterium]|nr:chitosanase [Cryptosporangiaceae bacterium]
MVVMRHTSSARSLRPRWAAIPAALAIIAGAAFVTVRLESGHAAEAPSRPAAVAPIEPKVAAAPAPAPSARPSLTDAKYKDIAMQLVSSAENSTQDWRAQFSYIEDIGDGRGYTGGLIGFTSRTHDMLALVEQYTAEHPGNGLAKYLPALRAVDGTDSHAGLGGSFEAAWRAEGAKPAFQTTQGELRDRVYFNPAVTQAKADGLHALGQFIYYDAIVMHGPGMGSHSFGGIRAAALAKAAPPSQGGNEGAYLTAFLNARIVAMRADDAHIDVSRIETAQRVFLKDGNVDLTPPLRWKVYGQSFAIPS